MEFPVSHTKRLSFSSSEGSFPLFRNNSTYVLQDPSLNLDMPDYVLSEQYEKIVFFENDVTNINLITLRRGLIFLKAVAHLSDPAYPEWSNIVNIIRSSLNELRLQSDMCLNSYSRWDNIGRYLKRSRRVISWYKIMRSLTLLANEIPAVEAHTKALFSQMEKLMLGTTKFAIEDKNKWEEEMVKIPRI